MLFWNEIIVRGFECKILLILIIINGVRKLGLVGILEIEIYLCKLVGICNLFINWDYLKYK